jgi:hypothetical protein
MKIFFFLHFNSITGKKVHGGKTKEEAIAENVLVLKSTELYVQASASASSC